MNHGECGINVNNLAYHPNRACRRLDIGPLCLIPVRLWRCSMREGIRLVAGAAFVVLALVAVRAAFDREAGRAPWAKRCLLILAVVAALAGIMEGLVVRGAAVSNHDRFYVRPIRAAQMATSFRGVSLGLLLALALSGQFSPKKPPQHSASDAAGAAPNGGPATPLASSEVREGPPSVS